MPALCSRLCELLITTTGRHWPAAPRLSYEPLDAALWPCPAIDELEGVRVRDRFQSWVWLGARLALGSGTALLAGCISPYYSAYPPPVYGLPPPYATQPAIGAPLPAPVPLQPLPQPRPEPLPEFDPPAALPEPAPNPDTALQPAPDPDAPGLDAPEVPAPAKPPIRQAEPGADAPLQGFRPMRGQTRPGI